MTGWLSGPGPGPGEVMDTGFLDSLGLVGDQDGAWAGNGPPATHGDVVDVHTPIDGSRIGGVRLADLNDYETVMIFDRLIC